MLVSAGPYLAGERYVVEARRGAHLARTGYARIVESDTDRADRDEATHQDRPAKGKGVRK